MGKFLAVLATLVCLAIPVGAFYLMPKAGQPQVAPATAPALPEPFDITEAGATMNVATTQLGRGEPVKNGDKVNMHYTGWTDGFNGQKKFDSSRDRGAPFSFQLGTGAVIKGWDLGVVGMKRGERRQLTIPSQLGYGERGSGANIPPGATLYFDVQCMGVAN